MSKEIKSTLIMSVLAIAFSAFAALLGEPFIPVASALVAAVWVTDRTPKHIASIVVSVILLLLNALIGGLISVIGIEMLLISAVIAVAYLKKMKKGTAALILTVLVGVATVASLIVGAMQITKVYTLESAQGFYEEMLSKMREGFTSMVESYIAALPEGAGDIAIPNDEINEIFDTMVGSLIGVITVIAFAISGFALKIFTTLMRRLTPQDKFIADWHFFAPASYAYFYFILYALSLFARGNGAFALTVLNLSTVFMAVFAYVGFRSLVSFASVKFGKGKTILISIAVLLFLSTIAMQLLAFFGAFATIAEDKHQRNEQNNS